MKNDPRKYIAIDVWSRRDSSTLLRHRCFRVEPAGVFCVQNVAFVRKKFDHNDLQYLERNYLELLVEEAPDERSGTFTTLAEAIEAHDLEFDDFWE